MTLPPVSARPPISNPPPADIVAPLPRAMPAPRALTLTGMPAPPSEPPVRDSREISMETVLGELGAQSAGRRAAESELAAAKKQIADATEREVERAKMRSAWEKLALQLGGGVVTLVVALCGYLGWQLEQLKHKSETADAQVQAQKAVMDGLPARVANIEAYERAEKANDDCEKSHVRSAIKRATGYDVTMLPDSTVVHWSSEGTKPNLTWFPAEQCVAPGSVGPRPPGSPSSP